MSKDLLPSLIQHIELAYNQTTQGQAAPAELMGVSLTLFLKRGSIVSMETMSVTEEINVSRHSEGEQK